MADQARSAFRERFGEEPAAVAVAPGRVNLIGEHTDYNDGYVLPIAIDRGIAVAASPHEGASALFSLQEGETDAFDVRLLRPGMVGGWGAYAAGMAWSLQFEGFEDLPNLRALVHGDLPPASGVSSSAALETAFGMIWDRLAGLAVDPMRLASIAQRAESRFVGVECGIMDMLASVAGRAGHALLLDTRDLKVRHVPIPNSLAVVVCDTRTPRSLAATAYNAGFEECRRAAQAMNADSLRDCGLDDLEAAKEKLGPILYRRARHVLTENLRCLDFVEALRGDDREALGRLMRESHESLRTDFEVSSRALDTMAEAAIRSPGCVGARMTGAGFGGSCVALAERDEADAFVASAIEVYRRMTGSECELWRCEPAVGARIVE